MKRSLLGLVPTLALLLIGAGGGDAAARLNRLVHRAEEVQQAFVGLEVFSLRDGRILYAHNADHYFIPASNMKLFTTALALMRLGPDYRFTTTIYATQGPDTEGRVSGDVVWVGSGDPTLSGRHYPYQLNLGPKETEFSQQPLQELAAQIVTAGVKEITGDIVGDDGRYVWEPHPPGWSVGDEVEDSGAPVSALITNDNRFLLQLTAGTAEGAPATAAVLPNQPNDEIENAVVTSADKTDVHFERTLTGQTRASGTILQNESNFRTTLAVTDPAVSAALGLREALIAQGVKVGGAARARHRLSGQLQTAPTGSVVARRLSPPLSQILQLTDKVSQNLHAEILLREVGLVRQNEGSRQAGLREMQAFLTEAGISPTEYHFVDGSGLARDALVTPAAVVKLLKFVYVSPQRELWLSFLPVGATDGSLNDRFHGHQAVASGISAKTGTLNHVRALSGYATNKHKGELAFSFLINNADRPGKDLTHFLDEAALGLLK